MDVKEHAVISLEGSNKSSIKSVQEEILSFIVITGGYIQRTIQSIYEHCEK